MTSSDALVADGNSNHSCKCLSAALGLSLIVAGCLGLTKEASAMSLSGLTAPAGVVLGGCTAEATTIFHYDITDLTSEPSLVSSDYDFMTIYLLDGTNRILDGTPGLRPVGTTGGYDGSVITAETPVSGPFRFVILDTEITSSLYSRGSTFPTEPADPVLADVSFNPQEWDPSCLATGESEIDETPQVISDFMNERSNQILGNGPDLIGFAQGTNTGAGGPLGFMAINGNDDAQIFAFSTSRSKVLATQAQNRISQAFAADEQQIMLSAPTGLDQGRAGMWDIWTQIHGARSNTDTYDSSFWVGYLGVHTFLTDYTLVGVLGQVDWSDQKDSGADSNADGMGWMVGPYIAGQLPGHSVFYEARAAWGQSNNEVSPDGTYTDDFETTRWLVSAKIAGAYAFGNTTIRPEARISWFEETQESYTDSNSQFIPEQTISLGEVRFGPSISHSITLDDGTLIQPSMGVSGVWNFGLEETNASQGFALGDNDLRARLDGGISTTSPTGLILAVSGHYDGIGVDDYDNYGGTAKVTVPLK